MQSTQNLLLPGGAGQIRVNKKRGNEKVKYRAAPLLDGGQKVRVMKKNTLLNAGKTEEQSVGRI